MRALGLQGRMPTIAYFNDPWPSQLRSVYLKEYQILKEHRALPYELLILEMLVMHATFVPLPT